MKDDDIFFDPDGPIMKNLSLDERVKMDEFIRANTVGFCPNCGSAHTSDCDSPLELIDDPTVGHCFDCGIYFCLECGYISNKLGKGLGCPHWQICDKCAEEQGYSLEFGLDGRSECPYASDVSECPKIKKALSC
jgi:hypothetical protein